MSGSSFRELLSRTSDTIERPRALATGHYRGKILRHEFGSSRQKQTPFVRFFLQPTEETEDVEAGANGGMDFTTREYRKDFFITPAAVYRLSDMLDAVLGKDPSRSFDERLPDTDNAEVIFGVTVRHDDERNEDFNDVTTIVKA